MRDARHRPAAVNAAKPLTCHPCRRLARAAKPAPRPYVRREPLPPLTCAKCAGKMHRSRGSKPQGEAMCHPCRQGNPSAKFIPSPCVGCGVPSYGVRCKPCASLERRIRGPEHHHVRRCDREQSAPGLNSTARSKLLQRWKRRGRACAYCDQLADTVDHVVPLIRGGTNFEGNLAPCCRRCNSSKAGYLIVEWRYRKRLPRITDAYTWEIRRRKPRPRKPARPAKQLPLFDKVCICGVIVEAPRRYCTVECRTEFNRRFTRDKYRAAHGLSVDPSKPSSKWKVAA